MRQITQFLNHVLLTKEDVAACTQIYEEAQDCARQAYGVARPQLGNTQATQWLIESSGPLFRPLFAATLEGDPACSPPSGELAHFFEDRLHANVRSQFGVFYTPRQVAAYIVKRTHTMLQDEFGLADGLADETSWGEFCEKHRVPVPGHTNADDPFVRILDPAVGTGVFLVETIDVVFHALREKWEAARCSDEQIVDRWNKYVPRGLLTRLYGLEFMSAPAAIAHLHAAAKLSETGFRFESSERLRLFVGNTLAGPHEANGQPDAWPAEWRRERDLTNDARHRVPFTVILGNPPYSATSNNRNQWIEDLIRGRDETGRRSANYYEIDGAPLGERKLWLHDDYVKFIRYGQWRLEQSGFGVLALVTNHGYLDNPTFRGMRQQLMKSFPRVTIVDLHGNRKKKERNPDGGRDENVFEIEQGAAIGFFRKPPHTQSNGEVRYTEVWGTREEKLNRLSNGARSASLSFSEEELSPAAAFYFFVPRNEARRREYMRGYKLTDIMPVNTTAAVTARDRFVIATQKTELLDRLRNFRDLSISDGEIRSRYFTNSRSRNYPLGDTRGWKLSEARKRLAEDPNWQQRVRSCLYRPFDRRFIYWDDGMIDWPRVDVMRHMTRGDNVALVARRQMPPGEPCNYFWIADDIVIDGYIRSDNRGSESIFPLYIDSDDGRGTRQPNFDAGFIRAIEKTFELQWLAHGTGDLPTTIGPEDILHLIYATFHMSEYRERFADQLRIDFPRIFLPRTLTILRQLCQFGAQLVKPHLLRQSVAASTQFEFVAEKAAIVAVARGYPKRDGRKVFLDDRTFFPNVPEETWSWHVGAYQVCRKWLKSRSRGTLTAADILHYKSILHAANAHRQVIQEIDACISGIGGWESAFA